ncbi:alpha/beta hydrolase [Actinomadura gamaensis]|uniref:Poly(ethylene terephthalate) hydrolase n=1 Tax=Actinomadura gamaensis TaxID=1763541 RepID=A0ABV9U3U3_9ACTN
MNDVLRRCCRGSALAIGMAAALVATAVPGRAAPGASPATGRAPVAGRASVADRASVAEGASVAGRAPGAGQARTFTNPYQRGPDPTEASVTAETGPFRTASVVVPANADPGFGGGTIYYPTDGGQGTFAPIVITPGFTGPQFSVAWYGPRLASQGFVVMTIDTLNPFDVVDQRGEEMLAALDYLTKQSSVKDRIDPARPGLIGHSMGGGGVVRAAAERPGIKAVIPLAPWDPNSGFAWNVKADTLVVGADNDLIAPVATFAEPIYKDLRSAPEKAYLELGNAEHVFSFVLPNTLIAKYSISWMKRFLDDDTRYDRFLCPPPAPGGGIKQYWDTCPDS